MELRMMKAIANTTCALIRTVTIQEVRRLATPITADIGRSVRRFTRSAAPTLTVDLGTWDTLGMRRTSICSRSRGARKTLRRCSSAGDRLSSSNASNSVTFDAF